MLTRTLAAGAALALGALVVPAGAAAPTAHVTDQAGDANGVNGQGLVVGGLADGSTTPVSYSPADLVSVTYSTTYVRRSVGQDGVEHVPTGVQARILTDKPLESDGPTLLVRLNVDIGSCGGFLQAFFTGPTSRLPGDTFDFNFQQFASRGCPADRTVRSPSWTTNQAGTTLDFDMSYADMGPAERANFALGRTISTRFAEVRTAFRPLTAPAIDTTGPGTDFKIGSDLPADVPCTTGCP